MKKKDGDLRPASRRERPTEFGKAGQGRVAVYQGEKPSVETAIALGPPKPKALPALKKMGLSRKEALYLQALVGASTHIEAYERAFSTGRGTYQSRRNAASMMHKRIIAKIGDDGLFEAMGIGRQATFEKMRQLKDAKMVKVFIDPKTAAVIESGEYNDNTTQMNATKLLAQVHRMVDGDKAGGGGQVIVNVVQYAPQGAPPWPGGGRS